MTKLSFNEEEAISKLLDRTQELIQLDKLEDAERFLNEIIKYKPDEINVPFQRGTIHMKKGEFKEALDKFLIVDKAQSDFFENLNNIATAYYKLKEYDNALFYYKKALDLKPDTDFILGMAASCLMRRGHIDEAISYLKRANEISPGNYSIHSDLLLAMIYSPSVNPEQLYKEALRFGENITKSCKKIELIPDRKRDRKIRIGYVSPDFRDHPVCYFLEPLLKNHDKSKFEIYAYSSTKADNPVMVRMKGYVDFWRDIRNSSTEEACDFILQDKIDILIDLAGHTSGNGLSIFASKPAAVQATWLGFPATTGLKTIDYKIADSFTDPPGMTECLHTETLWRLPKIFCSYQPPEKKPHIIDHPPFEDNGYITFGCFNNFAKAGDSVLHAWAEILKEISDAHLMLEIEGIDDEVFRKNYLERLKAQGLPTERVIIEPRKKANQFILYNKIDIALDPFPCVGGTTSMDTLWMGVPFVTLAGKSFGGRMGVSILSNVGLPELIAEDVDAYINIAIDLAKNRERLKSLRQNLREHFSQSPAMDHLAFTRDIEQAYDGMWQKYCGLDN